MCDKKKKLIINIEYCDNGVEQVTATKQLYIVKHSNIEELTSIKKK
jgi:hypothetical protein